MPQRVELTEQTGGQIGGLPFWVAVARDKRLVAFVGTIDGDGLLDTMEEVQAVGRAYLRKVDRKAGEAVD